MEKRSLKKKTKDSKEEQKSRIYDMLIQAIRVNGKLCFRNDLLIIFPYCRTTLDNWYPKETNRGMEIDRLLMVNRRKNFLLVVDRLASSDNAQAQIMLFKVFAEDEERDRLSSNKSTIEKEKQDGFSDEDTCIDINGYKEHVKSVLKDVNRYSPVLDLEIEAMASAWATLNAANRTISKLDSPFIEEVTTQGHKIVQHPAFNLQQKALESMSRHSKLLGIDFENAPDMATEGPLVSLTKEMISYTKAQSGHMSVDKANRKKGKKVTVKGENVTENGENVTKNVKSRTNKKKGSKK